MGDEVKVRSKREAKLNEYRQLREELQTELKTLSNRRKKLMTRLRDVGNAIYDLLHESDQVPSVTDHAVVRYLERVKGWNIAELKAEVANHKNAHREGNVVVTVHDDLSVAVESQFSETATGERKTNGKLAQNPKL